MMRYFYKLLAICLLLPLFQSNASISEEFPKPKSNAPKPLDCGIPAPTIVNYGCLDLVWQKDYKRVNSNYVQTLESPKKIYPTNDGGYIFASNSQFQPNNSGDSEYAIFKVDANGNRLWSKTFGTVDKDFLTAFVPTSDGGYVLGGYSEGGINRDKTSASKGSNDIWLIKINANGTKVWDKSFGGADQDLLASMIATSDGGFLLGGYSSSGNNGDKTDPYIGGYYDAWILKIDGSGNKIWDKTFGGTGYDATRVVAETTDGYIIGTQSSSGIDGNKTSASKGNTDFWILKIDFNGTKIWDNSYGGSNVDIPQAINKNADGSLIISGFSNSPISDDKSQKSRGLDDIWILKINSSGVKVWDKTIGGSNREYVTSATTTPTGNIIFNVDSYSNISGDKKHAIVSSNSTDQWLFEITPDGVQLWEKYLNGNYGFLTGSGDLIVHNNHLISLGNTDYSIARQGDFWNIGLKKISYCNAQPTTSTTICRGKCATLVAENCNSGVIKWSNGEYGASICTSPNTTQNYKSVCLSADSLCVGDSSAVFMVNVTPSDVVSISPSGFVNITSCGTSQTITATGCANGTLSWSNGQTGNPITFIPTNNQIVKAICTMPNGCVSESSYLSISVNNISAPTIFGRPSYPICAGQPITLFTNDCTGGTTNWTGGLTGSSITINPTSTFTMKVACSYPSGCVSDSSRSYPNDTIKVLPRPVAPTISNYSCLKKVWDKRFGGIDPEYFSKILKLSDGYLLAGTSRSSNTGDKTYVNRGSINGNYVSKDYWIVKIDNNGNKVWDRTYGSGDDDDLKDVIQLSDGGFMLAGISNSNTGIDKSEESRGGTDYWIIKIDASGNKIWNKTYGGSGNEDGNVIIKETSDGFILGGSSNSGISGEKSSPALSGGSNDFWILKLNPSGIKIWDKSYGGLGIDNLTSIELLENNEYLLLGNSNSPISSTNEGNKTSANKGNTDYWLVKINANGNKIWDRSYGGTSSDYPTSMVYTNDGKVTIAGQSTSSNSGDKSRSSITPGVYNDIWLIRVDTSGNKIWNKTYGGSENDVVPKIIKNNQGGYLMASSSYSDKSFDKSENLRMGIYTSNDYWIMELNGNGEKLWDKAFGGTDTDYPNNLIVDNNSIIIGGTSFSEISGDKTQASQGVSDYWLVKMDICQPNFNTSTTICKNDSTFLTVQGCPNASTVQWSNNESGQTLSVKPTVTTTYKAICISTDPGSCKSDSSTTFTVNINTTPPPTITTSSTNICIGESSTLTASGCQGTYGWTGGATTTNITVNPIVTKTHKVACTFNGCTSDSTSTTITVNPLPTKPIITTPNQNICVGGNIILSASGCNNGIYQWTGGLTGSSVSITPINTTSIYKVACKVSNCVSDSSLAVTITTVAKPAMPTITPPINSIVCGGTSVSLIASACPSGTLTWTGGLTGTSITVAPVATKSYKVLCTINGCSSDSSSAVIISVNPKPARPTISSTGNTVCQGQSVILTASACATGTYGWTGGLTTSSITITSLGIKSYKVACTVNGCTSDSSLVTTVQISTKPAPPVIVPPTSTSLCLGTSVSLLANGCISGTLGWTGGSNSPSFTIVLPVGVRTFKVACTVNGCTSDSSSAITITVSPKPAQPTINQASQTICAGQSLNLTVTPVSGNTYAWTSGLTGMSITVSPTATRIYKVAALANGCASDSSSSVTATVQATSPSPTTTNATICQGGTLIAGNGLKSTVSNCSGGGSNSVTATYSGGTVGYDGGSSSGSNPTATISGMSSTITKVRVSITWQKKGGGGATSCGSAPNGGNPYHNETSFKLRGPDGITVIDIINNGTFGIPGTSNFVTTVFEDGFPAVSSSGPVSGTFSPASLLSGFNGKTPNGVWTLLPNDSGTTDPLCVSGFSVTVTAGSVAVPSTVTWWDAQTSGNQMSTGSEYLPTTNTLASGTYTYYAQASCPGSCSSPRVATTLTVTAKPTTPTITPPTNSTVCQGSNVTLSATGCTGGTYAWTGGLTGSSISISPLSTRAYKVACTLNTCTSDSSSATTITVTPSPVFTLSSNKTSVCSGDTAILTITGCTGTISWSNGATTSIIKVSPVTNTTYTATCSVGTCSSNQSVSITPSVAPTVTASGILQCGQTVTLTANGLPVGSNIQWRKDGVDVVNATNGTLVINSAGVYDFTSYVQQQTSIIGPNSNTVQAVTFLNENVGLVGTTYGIYKTTDGGNSWTSVHSANIRSFQFINSTVVWAVGTNGSLLKSINGGDTWTSLSLGVNVTLNKVTFKDINNGIIVSDDFGLIFITTDGGSSWTTNRTFGGSNSPRIYSVAYVPNTTNIWIVGYNQGSVSAFVAKSLDNGITWINVVTGLSVSLLNDVVFTSQNNGFMVGYDGKVLKTVDGGISWQLVNTPVSNTSTYLTDIEFVNSQIGYILGSNTQNYLLETRDGGNTWKSRNLLTNLNYIRYNFSFPNEKFGWITHENRLIKYSSPQCSTTLLTITQTQRPNPPTITPPTNSTICQGSNITLSATGCTGGTYAWTGALTGSSISVSPSLTRAYKVACTLNTCISDSSSAVTINVTPATVFSVSSNKTSVCLGDTATLTISGCAGLISWSNGTTTSVIKVSPAINTTYTATCTLGSCSSNQSVNVIALSTPNVTASGILQCGQAVTLTANNVPVGSNIQWLKDGVDVANATNSSLVINNGGNYDFYSYILQYNSNSVGNLTVGKCVTFINETVGFVGNNQGIFKTTDGGTNWVLVHNAGKSVNSITFLTPLIGFAVGEQGFIYKTTNGGNTWSSSSIAGNSSAIFEKIKFKDLNNGIIVGGIAEIYYTNDGGVTWQQSSGMFLPNPPYFKGVSFVPNSSIAYAVGSTNVGRVILKSTNNGVSWSEVITTNPASSLSSLNDISFTTSNDGLLVGMNGAIYKTIDGGLTWQQQISGTTNMLSSLQYVNNQTAYICGSATLLKTFDGGNTWKSLSMNAYPVSLSFVNESTGWLTNYGSIIKYNAPQCSTIPKVMNNINCSDIETIKSGSWTDPTTWSANRVPTSTDDVIINIGHTVTDTGGTIRAKTLNYRGGILQLSSITNLVLGN